MDLAATRVVARRRAAVYGVLMIPLALGFGVVVWNPSEVRPGPAA